MTYGTGGVTAQIGAVGSLSVASSTLIPESFPRARSGYGRDGGRQQRCQSGCVPQQAQPVQRVAHGERGKREDAEAVVVALVWRSGRRCPGRFCRAELHCAAPRRAMSNLRRKVIVMSHQGQQLWAYETYKDVTPTPIT